MLWFIVTISTYLILAIVFLIDKYFLTGPIPNPKVYTFYIGALGALVLFLAPFVGFNIPEIEQIVLSLLAGACFIYAIFCFNKALKKYEASRIIPTIGGLTPLFTFFLVYIFSLGRERLSFLEGVAFLLLVLGSVLITLKKEKLVNRESLWISTFAAFLFSLSFSLSKYVYLSQSFWSGYIWIRMGGFLMALCFLLFSPEVKKEVFERKNNFRTKTTGIFLLNQLAGASANILQNWAIALVPLAYVSIINAIQGIQYAFLLIFTVLLSLKFPKILREEISREILFQKILAILLIGIGLGLLVIK